MAYYRDPICLDKLGNQSTKQRNTTMAQITVRLDEELKEKYRDYCDRNGNSMSGNLKDHIRAVTNGTDSGPLPDDPELAKAYRRLYELRSTDNRLKVEDAEPQIANILNIPVKTVRRRVLRKLDNRGYINVKVGIITVNVELEPSSDDLDTSAKPEKVEA